MFRSHRVFLKVKKRNGAEEIIRKLSAAPKVEENQKEHYKMKAWQIHSYGDVEELQMRPARIPHITGPSELLIKVDAASLNPIDRAMMRGYGRTILDLFRWYELEFPLTLGRDFAGTVVNKGFGVGEEFKVGDKVYGFVPLHKQGCHSELVVADKAHVCVYPQSLSPVEAASVPYAALTAWSALFLTGELFFRRPERCKILILGASGGVGTLAVQILKSQGATVVCTCSADAIPLVQSLKADVVLDYSHQDYMQNVAAEGKYDIILDCAQFGHNNVPETWKCDKFITLNSPLLVNTDKYGLVGGLAASANDLVCSNANCLKGKSVRWAFFVPSSDGFSFINQLVKKGEVRPVIHKVFPFSEMPNAFETLAAGHLRGKIVVNMQTS